MSEQIDQFFRPDGTLISIPVKAAKKIAVLTHIAQELSPTTKYPEKELNLIIAKYHDDTVAPSPNSPLTLVGMPLICAAARIESWAAISVIQ